MYTIFKGSTKGDFCTKKVQKGTFVLSKEVQKRTHDNEFLFPVNENYTSDVSPGFPYYSLNDF